MTNVRMRRFLLLVGFLCLSAVVNAEGWKDKDRDGYTGSHLWYTWTDNSKTAVKVIKAQNGEIYSGDYTIPETISVNVSTKPNEYDYQDITVTQIISEAFKDATNLAKVTVNADITIIDKRTFQNSGLTSITLPSSLETIDENAFYGTTQLTSIVIPNNVTAIGNNAFQKSGLMSVTLSSSLETIGANAFNESQLKEITIPANVNFIGGSAFYNCKQLEKATFASIEDLCNINFDGDKSNPLVLAKNLYIGGSKIAQLTIPATVKDIPAYAFQNCESIINITIEEGVNTIGVSAFTGCKYLTRITIPGSINTIGERAFQNDTSLKEVHYNDLNSIFSINYGDQLSNPLYYASSIHKGDNIEPITELTIKDLYADHKIPDYAFRNCTDLTKIAIESGLEAIGASAFTGCSSLNTIYLPNSITTIGKAAFLNNNKLKEVHYENLNSIFTISYGDKDANPLYYASSIHLGDSQNPITELIIPNLYTDCKIPDFAFRNITSLTKITIESGIEAIGASAFAGCSSLDNINIPNSITTIGKAAFNGDSKLKKVYYESRNHIFEIIYGDKDANPLYYANQLFEGPTTEITDLTIPEGFSPISTSDYQFFRYCTSLQSVTIGDGITTIGESTFEGCSSLRSIALPSTITNIGKAAFKDDKYIEEIHFPDQGKFFTINYGDNNAKPIYVSNAIRLYDNKGEIHDLLITDSYTDHIIPDYAFKNCIGLESVEIAENVTTIGEGTFSGCKNLKSVSLPSTITTIGKNAFKDDKNLIKARFATIESLCKIDYPELEKNATDLTPAMQANPLYYAHKLYIGDEEEEEKEVHIPNESLKNGKLIRPYILAGAQYLTTVTIPTDATEIGLSAFNGCTGLQIADYPSEEKVVTMVYQNQEANPLNYAKELRISGQKENKVTFTSDIMPYALTNCQWLVIVDIQEGVKSIGAGAFMNCKKLSSVTLPSTLTTIDDYAFSGCEIMAHMDLPSTLVKIGNYAFQDCKSQSFNKITIPANCSLGKGVFKFCSELTTVNLNNNDQRINESCFEGCTKLENITIPNTIEEIANSAFSGCTALPNIPYGDSPQVKTIGEYAFAGCTSFTEVVIKEPLEDIMSNAFNGCSNMTIVSLPSTTDNILQKGFYGCNKLENVVVLNANKAPRALDDAFGGKQSTMNLFVPEAAIGLYSNKNVWKDFNNKTGAKANKNHTLTFIVNGVIDKDPIELPIGTAIDEVDRNYLPKNYDKDNDVFSGWNEEIPLTMPGENITRYGYVHMKRNIEGTHETQDGTEFSFTFKYYLHPEEKDDPDPQKQKEKRATLIGIEKLDENDSEIEIPEKVTFDDVEYPVTSIGVRAFASYDKKNRITKINLPSNLGITEVDSAAFKGCDGLVTVENFKGITHVGDSAFYNCSNLINIDLSNVTKIDALAFYGCGSFKLKDGLLPSQIESIKYQAFANTGIEEIIINKDIFIGNEVFKGCTKLGTVEFGKNYSGKWLPKLIFWNCNALKKVSMGNSMESIHEGAFKGCTSLTSFVIPDNITTLGNEAFMGCSKLRNITIPASVEYISDKAFAGCDTLQTITAKPNTPPTLIENAFSEKTYKKATLYVDKVDDYDVSPWNKFSRQKSGKYVLTYILDADTIKSDSILVGDFVTPRPEAVKEKHEFSGWQGEPESMPGANVTVYGKFKYKLSFSYADGSEKPENDKEFSLPKDEWYFYGDAIDKDALLKALQWAEYDFDDIEIPATMPANDLSIEVMYRRAEQTPTFAYKNKTLNYRVYLLKNKAEVIASPDVTGNITIPANIVYNEKVYPVKAIQDGAFEGNQSITELNIEADIDSIGKRAFFDNRFKKFTITANVKGIGADAFLYCTSMGMEKVPLFETGSKVTMLPSGIFRNCYALEEVDLPASITKIEKNAFTGSSKLNLITINSETMPEADASSFDANQYNTTKLRVPSGIDIDNLPAPWNKFADRAHIGDESTAQECATPTVTYDKGKLTFECSTPGAEIVSWIDIEDAQQITGGEWELVKVYKVRAYATKTGLRKSKEIEDATITWCNGRPVFGKGFKSVTLEEANPKKGDINEDGVIDTNDAIQVVRIYLGKE